MGYGSYNPKIYSPYIQSKLALSEADLRQELAAALKLNVPNKYTQMYRDMYRSDYSYSDRQRVAIAKYLQAVDLFLERTKLNE